MKDEQVIKGTNIRSSQFHNGIGYNAYQYPSSAQVDQTPLSNAVSIQQKRIRSQTTLQTTTVNRRRRREQSAHHKNTHSRDAHNTRLALKRQRGYVHLEDILAAAHTKFSRCHEGLTYQDLYEGPFKLVETRRRAQDVLHYHKKKNNLFTSSRTRSNLQQYFATEEQAELAAAIKNTHSQPIGVQRTSDSRIFNRPNAPLNNILQHLKAQDFYHALLLTEIAPLGIHNIRFDLSLPKPDYYYRILSAPDEKENWAKKLEHRIGDVHVLYKSFPCGTVDISIACSKNSFRLETEWDVTELFAFVGGVRETLARWLRDVDDVIVPPLEYWRLVHADLSKDVKVPQKLHITVPNMELKIAERVFRLYVKTIGHESLLRLEEFRMFNTAFNKGIKSIVESRSNLSLNPSSFLELAELKHDIASLTTQLAQKDEIITGLAVQIQELRSAFKANNDNKVSGVTRLSQMPLDVVELVSAASLYEKYKSKPRISTGAKSLDDILVGGIETGAVTEFCGKAGSGKTQLCFTISVTVQRDLLSGDGRVSKVLFIDTENTFTAPRIGAIAAARGLDPDSILNNIEVLKAKSASKLEQFIENGLQEFLEQHPDIHLLIVDSIISRHRAEFRGRENLSQRQQSLNAMMHSLKTLADKFNIAVVVTNQLVDNPASYLFDITADTKAAGGNILAHASTHRIMFKPSGNNRIARIVDSPCYPVREVLFRINHQGLAEVPIRE